MPERSTRDDCRRTVCAAQAGSGDALGILVEIYRDGIERYFLIRSNDPEVAADLSQEVFLCAFEGLGRLEDADAFPAWLYRIAHNRWKMWLRSRRRHREILLSRVSELRLPVPSSDRAVSTDQILERDLIEQAFLSLTVALQEALRLRHVTGLSDAELGEVLGISAAAAQKRAHRATAIFRQRYETAASIDPSLGETDEVRHHESSKPRLDR